MKSAKHVVKYLGRYTHRIAISNARIKKYEDNKVTFSYKDYSNHNQIKEMTLDDTEFFRRYMMHVLPSNFMKIRHYGFLGNRNKEERIKAIRTATNTKDPGPFLIDYEQIISDILKETFPSALNADKNVTTNWNNPTNSKVTSPMKSLGKGTIPNIHKIIKMEPLNQIFG